MKPSAVQFERPWAHRLAVLVALTTFPLIWVGGLVTTYEAGMAVPDWPNTYGYNLFAYPWTTWLFGPWDLFIEHGHRLLGATVGMLTIGLATMLWLRDDRRWMRALGIVALLAVIAQGVLGGLRVLLDERLLAKIHGCFGPAFFTLCVAIVIFTSRRWRSAAAARPTAMAGRFQRLAWMTLGLAYAQLVVGANLRHMPLTISPATFRALVLFHILLAIALVVHVALLNVRAWRQCREERAIIRATVLLGALVVIQVSLGVVTWIENYGFPAWSESLPWAAAHTVTAHGQFQSLVTTAHVAVGSLILASSLAVALQAGRWLAPVASAQVTRPGATPAVASVSANESATLPLTRLCWPGAAEVHA